MQTIRNPKKNVDFVLLPKADQRALVHAVPSGEDLMTAHGVETLLLGDCEIPIGHQLMVRPPPSSSLFRYVRSGNKSKPVDDMHTVPVKPGGLQTGTLTWCKVNPGRGVIRVTATPSPSDTPIQCAKFDLVGRPEVGASDSADAFVGGDADGGGDEALARRVDELELSQRELEVRLCVARPVACA